MDVLGRIPNSICSSQILLHQQAINEVVEGAVHKWSTMDTLDRVPTQAQKVVVALPLRYVDWKWMLNQSGSIHNIM